MTPSLDLWSMWIFVHLWTIFHFGAPANVIFYNVTTLLLLPLTLQGNISTFCIIGCLDSQICVLEFLVYVWLDKLVELSGHVISITYGVLHEHCRLLSVHCLAMWGFVSFLQSMFWLWQLVLCYYLTWLDHTWQKVKAKLLYVAHQILHVQLLVALKDTW